MAIKLYARTRGGFARQGGWYAVQFSPGGDPLPSILWGKTLVDESEITSYTVRINGKYIKETRRKNLADALRELRRCQIDPKGAGPEFVAALVEDVPANRGSLAAAAAKYLAQLVPLGKAKGTIDVYTLAVNAFVAVCLGRGTVTLDQLASTGHDDAIAYMEWLRNPANVPRLKYGNRETTIKNRMRHVDTFLRTVGIKLKDGLLAKNEWPKSKPAKGAKYDADTIKKLLAVADVNETDLIQFLLFTGFRDGEVQHCEWSDIDFVGRTINVSAKAGWQPKDKESREQSIPLPPEFVQRMKDRRVRQQPASNLIFPSQDDTPDTNLILKIHRVAKRAGVECRVTLHAFRRTFGSTIARKYGIEVARQYLGHSNIATTARYLVADGEEQRRVQAGAADTFAEFTEAA